MKIQFRKIALLLSIVFAWNNNSFAQCNWQTLPNGETVNSIARVREDKNVLRSEVFTLSDGSVYAAYWYADKSLTVIPFSSGAWQLGSTTTLDFPNGTVDNLFGWDIGKLGTDTYFVCISSNGVFSKNLSTTAIWGFAPLPGSGALTASAIKDVTFHPTSGEVHVLRQSNTTTLAWSKLNGSNFSVYTDLGTVKDVTTNTVYYADGSTFGASTTANTVSSRYMPQLKFYGSNNDAVVAYGLHNSEAGTTGFFPRAVRYNTTTSSWGVVTVNFNSGARQSFVNYVSAQGTNFEFRAEDFELSAGPGRPYFSVVEQDGGIHTDLFVMNLLTNEAHDIYNADLESKLILRTFSDANNNFIGEYTDGNTTTTIYKRDNATSTWAAPQSMSLAKIGGELKAIDIFTSGTNLYTLDGAICRPAYFGFYNSQMPSTAIYKTRLITAPYNYIESNFWTADLGIPGTHSTVINGINNDLIIAYADTMYTDSTYRVAFKKWDGTSWVSAGILSFGSSTDAVEDFDIVYNGTDYYLAQVKAAGDCDLYRIGSSSATWQNLGVAVNSATRGASRFVRVSTNGTFGSTINILTASKLGAVNKLNHAQYQGIMYPGSVNDLNFFSVASKYHMQVLPINVNRTLMLYTVQSSSEVKYLSGGSWINWSANFNTDFIVGGWKSFDAQYDATSGELLVAYNTAGGNAAFKRAKVNASGDFDQTTTNTFTQLGAIPNAVYNTNVYGYRIALATSGTKVYALTSTYPENKMVLLKGDKSTGTWESGTDFSLGQSRNQDMLTSPTYGVIAKWGGHNIHVMNLPSAPAAPVNTTTTLTACSGQTKTLTVTSGGATVNWFTTPTGGTAVGTGNSFTTPVLSASTTYYAEATNACGTSATRTAIALTIGTSPTVTASATATTVCSGTSVTFTGGGADTYTWNNGVTNNTPFSVTTGGNYIVTGTAANGCTGTATVTMIVNQAPTFTASFSTNDTLCQGSLFDINVTSSAYSSSSITNSANATSYNFTNATNLVANANVSYYLSATGSNSCISRDTLDMVVTVTPAPTSPSLTAFVPLTLTGFNHDIVANGTNVFTSTTNSVDATSDGCRFIASDYTQYGTPTRFLPNGGSFNSAVASTANLPFQFANYVGNNSLTLETGTMNGTLTLASPTAMTDFYLLATSGGGSTVVNMTINFTDGTAQTINNQTITDWFFGSDAAILGTGRYYNGALGFQAATDNNPRLYQFLIDIAAANESKLVQSVTFNRTTSSTAKTQIMAMTAVTQLSNQTFCSSDLPTVADLDATGTNVEWFTSPTGGSALATTSALTTGTFYSAQTLNGCSSFTRGSVSVTVNASPARTVNASVCGSDYTYNGTTYTSSGTYYQTAAAPSGCDSLITLNVSITPTPSLSIVSIPTSASVCEGESVTLTASGATTITWDSGITNNVPFTVTSSEYYQVIGTTNGCSDTMIIQVDALSLPTSSISSTNTSCTANTGTVTLATVSGGPAPFSFDWNTGETTQNLTNVGVGVYTVIITDDNGCTSDYSVSVNSDNAPTLTIGGTTDLLCNGDLDGSVDLTATGGTGALTFAWDDSNSSTTEDLSGIGAGTYTVIVMDAANCSSTTTFTINEPTVIVESGSSTNVSCGGAADGSVDVTVIGGTAPYTYAWSNGATTPNLPNLSGDTYSATITDANGCTLVSADYEVLENAPINITGTTTDANCGQTDGAVDINVSGGTGAGTYSTTWNNGASTEDLTSVAAGSYIVTVTDTAGCSNQVPFNINSIGGPVVNGNQLDASCTTATDGSIDVTATGTGTINYSWSNGATTEDLSGLATGTYTVTVTDDANCPSFQTFIINGPVYTATSSQNGGTLTADISGAIYQWINCTTGDFIAGETNQTFTPTADGSYAAIVSEGQCSDTTDCITITDAGISESNLDFSFNAYPNPSTGIFYIESPEASTYIIYDALGRILVNDTFNSGVNKIDLSTEETGIYFLRVSVNELHKTVRLIKNN